MEQERKGSEMHRGWEQTLRACCSAAYLNRLQPSFAGCAPFRKSYLLSWLLLQSLFEPITLQLLPELLFDFFP